MRVFRALTFAFSFSICSLWALTPAFAQLIVAISVDVAPPPLPVYVQPPIPARGYLWVPGYWGWDDGYYVFHDGYWGPHIGFYGGVVYGFGYDGSDYPPRQCRYHSPARSSLRNRTSIATVPMSASGLGCFKTFCHERSELG